MFWRSDDVGLRLGSLRGGVDPSPDFKRECEHSSQTAQGHGLTFPNVIRQAMIQLAMRVNTFCLGLNFKIQSSENPALFAMDTME